MALMLSIINPLLNQELKGQMLWDAYFQEMPDEDFTSENISRWKKSSLDYSKFLFFAHNKISVKEAIKMIFNKNFLDKPAWNKRYLRAFQQWTTNFPNIDHQAILIKGALKMGIELIRYHSRADVFFSQNKNYVLLSFSNSNDNVPPSTGPKMAKENFKRKDNSELKSEEESELEFTDIDCNIFGTESTIGTITKPLVEELTNISRADSQPTNVDLVLKQQHPSNKSSQTDILPIKSSSLSSSIRPRLKRGLRKYGIAPYICNLCPHGDTNSFPTSSKLKDHKRAEHVPSVVIRDNNKEILAQLARDPITKMFQCQCGSLFKSTRNATYHRKCYEPEEEIDTSSVPDDASIAESNIILENIILAYYIYSSTFFLLHT